MTGRETGEGVAEGARGQQMGREVGGGDGDAGRASKWTRIARV